MNINEHFLPESYCTQWIGAKVRIAQKTSVAAFRYWVPSIKNGLVKRHKNNVKDIIGIFNAY